MKQFKIFIIQVLAILAIAYSIPYLFLIDWSRIFMREEIAPSTPQEVTLHFGHQGVRDFYAYTHGESDDYPEIMSFYSLYWDLDNTGVIHLKHFGSTTTIPNVTWAMGTKNSSHTHGIGGIDVHADLSKTKFATPEQAYQDYVALITALKNAGWRQYFNPWDARIAKEDNFKILMHDDDAHDELVMSAGFSSDGTAILSFEEWQKLMTKELAAGFNGHFYLRDVKLWLKIDPTNTKPNPIPNQPDLEQYMIRYEFNTAKYDFYRSDLRGWSLEQQKQKYDEDYKSSQIIRQEYEATAMRAGFRIDENYQDPDMWQYIIEPDY